MGYSRKKNKQEGGGGVEDILFLKPRWNFLFIYFTSGNSRQIKGPPLEIVQDCVTSLGNSKTKNHDSWKFHMLFL